MLAGNAIIRLFILSLALLLAACSLNRFERQTQLYRIRAGETLYAIAWRYQLDFKTLAKWNGIKPPYVIHPGQKLVLVDPARLPEEPQASKPGRKKPTRPSTSGKAHKPAPAPKNFRWPTNGKVVRRFDGRKDGSQGIDIAGQLGQNIVSAGAGKVVYSGDGLVGYGNLIIIKHNEDYLSAYAYNRVLLVKEGEVVKSGQKIAQMGQSQPGSPRLHFEIRRQGEPVNPLKYLPKR